MPRLPSVVPSPRTLKPKRGLELAEALKVCKGVEGRNEKERAAKLRLELTAECTALYEAEDVLTEVRCALEVARPEWDLARYSVRTLQLSSHVLEIAA